MLQDDEVDWHSDSDHQGGELEDGEGLKMYIHIEGAGTSKNVGAPIHSPRSQVFTRETLQEAMNETVDQQPSVRDSHEFTDSKRGLNIFEQCD